MKIFIDTEFTDFQSSDLISIGLVSDDNRQFYGERNDFSLESCNAFVRETVLPLLGKNPTCIYSQQDLSMEVRSWLEQFKDSNPILCFDFQGDIDLLRDLLGGELPTWMECRNVGHLISQQKLNWYIQTFFEGRQHHALYDALANKFAFQENS